MSYPPCFSSQVELDLWEGFAIKAREEVCPCHDCTRAFEVQMLAQERCFKINVEVTYLHHPKKKTYPDYKLPKEAL